MPMHVDIQLGKEPHIEVSGKEARPLREDQLSIIGGRGRLEELVRRRFDRKADGVHLCLETMDGKLRAEFSKYKFDAGWKDAQLIAELLGGDIIDVDTELEATATQPVYNIDRDTPARSTHKLFRDKTNRISKGSHWDTNAKFAQSFTAEVEGGVDIGIKVGGKVSGTSTFEFSAGYGETTDKSEEVRIGNELGTEVDVGPMDATVMVLNLNVGKVKAQVDKRERIIGGVYCHFGKRVKANGQGSRHYLWWVPFSQLFHKDDLRSRSHDIITVDNYVNAPVGFRDPVEGEIPEWEKARKAAGMSLPWE